MPRAILQAALDQLVEQDPDLFQFGANERSLTHKLAEYLQPYFPEYHVDCEYNRDGHDDPKILDLPIEQPRTDDTEAKTVYPDVIVHRRGILDNLLVIEAKKSTSQVGPYRDLQKLDAFVNQMGYRNAAFVIFRMGDQPGYDLAWIHPAV